MSGQVRSPRPNLADARRIARVGIGVVARCAVLLTLALGSIGIGFAVASVLKL